MSVDINKNCNTCVRDSQHCYPFEQCTKQRNRLWKIRPSLKAEGDLGQPNEKRTKKTI